MHLLMLKITLAVALFVASHLVAIAIALAALAIALFVAHHPHRYPWPLPPLPPLLPLPSVVGLSAPRQRYSTIKEEEVCRL